MHLRRVSNAEEKEKKTNKNCQSNTMPPSEPKNNVMSAMQKLQHLSLINKVTKELDKSLGVNDKTLAEFVVDVAKSSKFDPQTFFRELQKNGAELPEPFANELVGMIERLANKGGGSTAKEGEKKKAVMEKPTKENPFPGLHRPDAEEHAKMLSRELYGERNPIENACDDPRLDKMNPGRLDENKKASSSGRGAYQDDDSAYRQKKNKKTEPAKRTIRGKPEIGKVYRGNVTNVMDFGAFVELVGFVDKTEGLAHVSKLPRVPNGNSARDVVQKGNSVYVKVLSLTNNRIALSMSDVNQETGEEEMSYANNLPPPPPRSNPAPPRGGGSSFDDSSSNPIVPRFGAGAKGSNMNTVKGLSGIKQSEEDFAADGRIVDDKSGLNRRRPIKRMSSPELWEARQLIASGVLKVEDYPNFDPENDGVLAYEEEAEEEFDIEINEEEAPFLAGQTDAALGDILSLIHI